LGALEILLGCIGACSALLALGGAGRELGNPKDRPTPRNRS
jgi:hypothetical protein